MRSGSHILQLAIFCNEQSASQSLGRSIPLGRLSWLTPHPILLILCLLFLMLVLFRLLPNPFFETSYRVSLFSFVRNRAALKCFLCECSASRASQMS